MLTLLISIKNEQKHFLWNSFSNASTQKVHHLKEKTIDWKKFLRGDLVYIYMLYSHSLQMSEPCTTLRYSNSFVCDGRGICEQFFTPQHRQNTPSHPSAAPPLAAVRMSKVKVTPAADPYASDDRKGWDSSPIHERGESGNKKTLPRPSSLLSRRGAKGTCDSNMDMFHLLCPGFSSLHM